MLYLISATLAIFLGACSASKSENNALVADSLVSDMDVVVDESKLLHDKAFRESMLQSCLPSKTFQGNSAALGEWYELKNCNIQFNGIRVGAKDISLHLDKGGDVNAFSMIIFPETEYGRYLSKNYGTISVAKEGKLCIKYYSNTLPELKVANDSLCESLAYNQI